MGRPTGATYDQIEVLKGLQEYKHMAFHGIIGTVLGTVASTAAVKNLIKLPTNSNIKITGVTYQLSGGGTGAATAPAPALLFSLAGTGAVQTIASAVWGTRADNTWVEMTLSDSSGVDVAAGDVISLGAVAGTVAEASEIVNQICIEYKEDWD